jgi:hypothetical protein
MIVWQEGTLSDLDEMAGFRKEDSGLPVNLWLDDSSRYKRSGHWKRIKFQNDHGNKLISDNLLTMTISPDPKIPEEDLRQLKLNSRDINRLKQFVRDNLDLLSKLADQDITFSTFIRQVKL